MSNLIVKSLAVSLLPLGLAWGAAAGGPEAEPGDPGLLSCDIHVSRQGGVVALEALAFAPVPATGTYEMQISQSGPAGSSSINQSGEFRTGPGIDGSLGIVSLPMTGSYLITLTVHWDHGAPDCLRQVDSGRAL
jgi:hypothetical protein